MTLFAVLLNVVSSPKAIKKKFLTQNFSHISTFVHRVMCFSLERTTLKLWRYLIVRSEFAVCCRARQPHYLSEQQRRACSKTQSAN